MTQDEIEGELHSLRDQFLQLQQQREDQRKYWFRWGVAAFCAGAVRSNIVTQRAHSGSSAKDGAWPKDWCRHGRRAARDAGTTVSQAVGLPTAAPPRSACPWRGCRK